MNPADQARKVARKKELKKNKKQRTAVRQAILKSKDVDDIIEQLRKLDQMEMQEPTSGHALPERVIADKRQKVREISLHL